MNMHGVSGYKASSEWKIVGLLSLGYALVGIDRFMIMPLFPAMMKDLHLDYRDLGHITGALSIAWGISAMFMSNLSDRVGRRAVIVPATIMFSLLAGLSGAAAGVGSLILIRVVMGLAEGAYTPTSIAATIEASAPNRHGLNVGIQQVTLPLFGLGLAPIVVTQLLKFVPWHVIFGVISIPGFIIALLLYRTLPGGSRQRSRQTDPQAAVPDNDHKWFHVLRYRNILLNIVGMLCWLTCLIVLSALFPSYLVDYLHLDVQQMGYVLSAIGFGGTAGTIVLPYLSDRLGRKPVMIVSVLGALVFLVLLAQSGPDPTRLFICLTMSLMCVFSAITLTVGPISAESVPLGLTSTASGIVIGIAEVFGGGIAPVIAGQVAQRYGIQYIMYLAIGALAVGLVVALSLKESAPGKTRTVADASLGTSSGRLG